MAGFNGRWSLFELSGADDYFSTIKCPDDFTAGLMKVAETAKSDPSAYMEEYTIDKAAGTIHRCVYINGAKARESPVVKLGTDFDGKTADGRSAKVKFVLESDTKLVRFENGDGFSTITTSELDGDVVTTTGVGNGATKVSKMKRV